MRHRLAFALRRAAVALLLAGAAAAAPAPAPTPPSPAAVLPDSADAVLAKVREHLYAAPVRLRGELLCGRSRGKLDRVAYLDADLAFQAVPPRARFTLSDAFGAPAEELTLVRAGDVWNRAYARGRPLAPAPAPPPDSPLAGSDLTWDDLSLGMLWWAGGVLAAKDRWLERECLVLEFAPPQAPRRTRLWIDERWLLLVKLEDYENDGRLRRRMTPRTFKKVGDAWILKDLDLRRWPDQRRTLLRITGVESLAAPAASAERDPGV